MNQCPEDCRYSASHEWVRLEQDDIFAVGISDHAQCQLGDLVFVELPEVSKQLEKGEEAAVVESVKTAADVYSPLTGEVMAVNEALEQHPELVNQDPYGEGWLYKIKISDKAQVADMMDANAYRASISEE